MDPNRKLRALPSVGRLLNHPAVAALVERHGHDLAAHVVRTALDRARRAVLEGAELPDQESVVAAALDLARGIALGSLKPVINATGVVLHTNLGRAPLGRAVLEEVAGVAGGYCNLEFDLETGTRGSRNTHVSELLRFVTSAEDVLVVNNNAAGIILMLNTLADGREVIVSRGELIEIGGSFRIPDIMAASGAVMVEVGTTNRTRSADYEQAIGPQTALIFKAHKSNYAIRGFTEEASVAELARLAHEHGLPMVYDVGSGLLRRAKDLPLGGEPDVPGALRDGADLVLFSCDKLLGGPQAGCVAGRGELVRRLAGAPMMRALRVGKLTLAALAGACRHWLTDESLLNASPTFALLGRSREEVARLAGELLRALESQGVSVRLTDSVGRCGGGSLPDVELPSMAVEILPASTAGGGSDWAGGALRRLLGSDRPVVAVVREGRLLLDVLTIFESDIPYVARAVAEAVVREA